MGDSGCRSLEIICHILFHFDIDLFDHFMSFHSFLCQFSKLRNEIRDSSQNWLKERLTGNHGGVRH